jgi:2-polyprenyl-6-methoxyphenol hydroxylase-like FAD-dependent oxidoreductase
MTAKEAGMPSIPQDTTTCCIVGCGPAGAMLGLLLARAGVAVLVLEKHNDFFRDFRGDTIHPSTLDVLDELGLGERFAEVPQQHVAQLRALTDEGMVSLADLTGLAVAHPHIAFVPQWDFLDFLTDAARELPHFELHMGAEVVGLLETEGRVAGVRYRTADGLREVAAALTVAADGRHSLVRRGAGLEPVAFGAPMDVLWFRLSREEGDPDATFGRFSAGHIVAMIHRGDYWQVGYVIPKGSDLALRRQGIDTLRSSLAELMPPFADRTQREPGGWEEVKTLEVQVNRLKRWHRPGLLCIGDAAHAMSPVGGVGINLAVQDAVAAANLLVRPLKEGRLKERDLARVGRRRWFPTVVTQAFQRAVGRRVLAPTLVGGGGRTPKAVRALARFAFLRKLPARLLGIGVLPEHVRIGRAPTGSASEVARGSSSPERWESSDAGSSPPSSGRATRSPG